jgi:hypothetical protein
MVISRPVVMLQIMDMTHLLPNSRINSKTAWAPAEAPSEPCEGVDLHLLADLDLDTSGKKPQTPYLRHTAGCAHLICCP